jgi:hypothetical protein
MKVVHVVSGGFVIDGCQFKTGDVVTESHRLFSKLVGRIKPDTELKKTTRVLLVDDQSDGYDDLKDSLPKAQSHNQIKKANETAIRQVMGTATQKKEKIQGIQQRVRQQNGRSVLITEDGKVDVASASLKVKELDVEHQKALDEEMRAIIENDFADEPKLLVDFLHQEAKAEVVAPAEVAPAPAAEVVEPVLAPADEVKELLVASDEASKPKRNKKS